MIYIIIIQPKSKVSVFLWNVFWWREASESKPKNNNSDEIFCGEKFCTNDSITSVGNGNFGQFGHFDECNEGKWVSRQNWMVLFMDPFKWMDRRNNTCTVVFDAHRLFRSLLLVFEYYIMEVSYSLYFERSTLNHNKTIRIVRKY